MMVMIVMIVEMVMIVEIVEMVMIVMIVEMVMIVMIVEMVIQTKVCRKQLPNKPDFVSFRYLRYDHLHKQNHNLLPM